MILSVQIYSLLFSFAYGIFIYFLLELINKLIFNKKIFVRIFFSLLFSFIVSLLYFLFLVIINNGYIHVYFFIMILLGYTLAKIVCVKLFVKRK